MSRTKRVPVVADDSLVARVDEIGRRIGKVSGIEPSRAAVLKLALERGVACLETDHPAPAPAATA